MKFVKWVRDRWSKRTERPARARDESAVDAANRAINASNMMNRR